MYISKDLCLLECFFKTNKLHFSGLTGNFKLCKLTLLMPLLVFS